MNEIKSMTGFGRAEAVTDEYRLVAEIKSVNHRYTDLSVKMPRYFNAFDARLRQLIKSYVDRGKVDVYITFDEFTDDRKKLIYNDALAGEYVNAIKMISENFGIRDDISAGLIARLPDVLSMEEISDDDGRYWEILEPVIKEAARRFIEERVREGEQLKNDILIKLDKIEDYVKEIEVRSPFVVEEYRKRLYNKLRETLSDTGIAADESRVVTEVAIFADKVCTDEEMVRLKSHVGVMRNKLVTGGSCGRELDFIAQEMNREANTALSKANSLDIADTAIALKTEIEKIREQVQNIE